MTQISKTKEFYLKYFQMKLDWKKTDWHIFIDGPSVCTGRTAIGTWCIEQTHCQVAGNTLKIIKYTIKTVNDWKKN